MAKLMFYSNSGGNLEKSNWKVSALFDNCERSPAIAF